MRRGCHLIVNSFRAGGDNILAMFVTDVSQSCVRDRLVQLLAEGLHIPCAVRPHATEQNNCPKQQLRAHPPLPMCGPQPLWKSVRAGHDDDIESQKLSHYPQSPMHCGHLIIPLMSTLGARWLQLSMERRPHHESDH